MNWISVKDRLPEIFEPILGYVCSEKDKSDNNGYMIFGVYRPSGFSFGESLGYGYCCTHWISRRDIPKPD